MYTSSTWSKAFNILSHTERGKKKWRRMEEEMNPFGKVDADR